MLFSGLGACRPQQVLTGSAGLSAHQHYISFCPPGLKKSGCYRSSGKSERSDSFLWSHELRTGCLQDSPGSYRVIQTQESRCVCCELMAHITVHLNLREPKGTTQEKVMRSLSCVCLFSHFLSFYLLLFGLPLLVSWLLILLFESSSSPPCLFLPQSLGKIDKPVRTQLNDQAHELSFGNILRGSWLAAVHLPFHESWSQQRIEETW